MLNAGGGRVATVVKDQTLDGQPNPHYVVGNEDLVTTRFFCVFPSNSNPVRPHDTHTHHRTHTTAHDTTHAAYDVSARAAYQIPYGLDLSAQLGEWMNQNYPAYGKQHSALS